VFIRAGIEVIKCGGNHSIALTTEGEVFTWGSKILAQGNVDICYEP